MAVSKKYANPPVIEAVCEFRFSAETSWDLAIHGLVYEKVADEFPTREPRIVKEMETTPGPQGVEQKVVTSERIVLLSPDRSRFVQLGPRLLAINCLKPYPSWSAFKPNIDKAFDAVASKVDIKGLQRIGLRYINRIEIPGQSVDLDEHFDFRPYLGENLPQQMLTFIVGSVLPFHDERDTCKVQLTRAVSDKTDTGAFLLDLDYSLAQPEAVAPTAALEWVDAAHQEVEAVFEGCITDSLRTLFEEAG